MTKAAPQGPSPKCCQSAGIVTEATIKKNAWLKLGQQQLTWVNVAEEVDDCDDAASAGMLGAEATLELRSGEPIMICEGETL